MSVIICKVCEKYEDTDFNEVVWTDDYDAICMQCAEAMTPQEMERQGVDGITIKELHDV